MRIVWSKINDKITSKRKRELTITTTIDIANASIITIVYPDWVPSCLSLYANSTILYWILNVKKRTKTIINTKNIYATTLLKKEYDKFLHITYFG